VPGNLGRTFTIEPIYDAGPFEVCAQNKRITVGELLAIRGRVVDHKGSPAAGAKVFLREKSSMRLVDGKPESFSGHRSVTDKDGRFAIDAAKGKGTGLVVSAPTCHVWHVPLGDTPGEITIKLPEPATLELLYDIPGDAPKAKIAIHMKSWDMPGWKRVAGTERTVIVPQSGRVVLNDMTPGLYDIWRSKIVIVGRSGTGAFCDRGNFTLTGGKTATADFVRKEGHPVTGRIRGMAQDSAPGVELMVQRKVTTPPHAGTILPAVKRTLADALASKPNAGTVAPTVKWITFDALACKPNGPFKTARLSPGTYTISAKAYAPMSNRNRYSLGLWRRSPAYTGSATVTVGKDRPPAEVIIKMTKPKK